MYGKWMMDIGQEKIVLSDSVDIELDKSLAENETFHTWRDPIVWYVKLYWQEGTHGSGKEDIFAKRKMSCTKLQLVGYTIYP